MHRLRSYPTLIASLLTALLLFAFSTTAGFAQDDADSGADEAAENAEAEPEGSTGNETVFQLIAQGGWPMIVLGIFLMGTVGLSIYNFMSLREKSFLVPNTIDELEPKLAALDLDSARQICEDTPSPVTNILLSGLDRASGEHIDTAAMEKAMEEASVDELAAPFGMVSYLNAIATMSPMVGLLGTVLGMVQAFQNIAAQGFGNPGLLAGDIQMALITTAGGLIVALPSMLAYLYFKNRYTKLASGVNRVVGDLFHTMLQGARGEVHAEPHPPEAPAH
ncbi:MAG: MotA/TolQ/ExbB proton channel family protein [Opitutales bacterium]